MCTGYPDSYTFDLVPGYLKLVGWQFALRDSSTITADGQVELYNPVATAPLVVNVSGFVSVPATFTAGPSTSSDGSAWTLSVITNGQWNFGGGLTVPVMAGTLERTSAGALICTMWNAQPIGATALHPNLLQLRDWTISNTLTLNPSGVDSTLAITAAGVANSAICTNLNTLTMRDMDITFAFSSAAEQIDFSAVCPTDSTFFVGIIPSIESITLRTLTMTGFVQRTTSQVQLSALFHMATSATSLTSDCSAHDTQAQCISATIAGTFVAGFETSTFQVTASLTTAGAWVEPLRMRNFAVINPNLAATLFLRGGTPSLSGVEWTDVSLFYKKPALATWPAAITGNNKATLGTDGLTALRGSADIVEFTTSFLYAPYPHGDTTLPPAYPRFAIRTTITNLDLLTLLTMFYDATSSVFSLLTGVSTPAAPTIGGGGSELAWMTGVTFSGSGELSLVTSGTFTRGIAITATAATTSTFQGISMTLSMSVNYVPSDDALAAFCFRP
jgi:hypothetical protein